MVFAKKEGEGGGRLLLVHINRIFQADRDLLAVRVMRVEIHNRHTHTHAQTEKEKNQSSYNLIVGTAAMQAAAQLPSVPTPPTRRPQSIYNELKNHKRMAVSECTGCL